MKKSWKRAMRRRKLGLLAMAVYKNWNKSEVEDVVHGICIYM